ncbi:kinesin-like protein KIN-7O [Acanthaster planci]|uniref:Kinesin-like protein KIN-7O n=1 Tax=Acanthaster planci TaxID=133434 RepID=A0A8B7XLG5_ACAPL|nr:kinesin-like protein KIN-7O [Acanthaster planci]
MDNVHVAIRVRPLIQREKQVDAVTHWKADTHTITQVDQRGKACRKEYLFDRVFDSSETTNDVYEEIAQPIVVEAMDGINGTIFAYGQTSSGKTYTMMGDSESPGIIPCAVQDIFDSIQNTPNREFLLRVSYMELYNEGLCDLLSNEKKSLQIREVDKRVFVHDLTEEVVTQPEDVLQLLKKGEARRHFGQTDMNERSSRSHTIFCMIVESRERADRKRSMELAVKVSHLNLVDLAGSERANETKAEGTRLKEACRINQSLHQLAMVINKLSQGADFIPFRDSKLTRILQTSLGGNAKTAIICTITPASIDQTHSTLQFASRAKTIKNTPEVNEVLSDEAMMQRQKKEIQELKRKILELEQQGEVLEEKASLHEQQEQRIKMLEKMILVSGGGRIMPGSETKKAKYKRRQTWCPGTGPLPLLPITKPAAPSTIEEASFVSQRTHNSSDGADSSPSASISPTASTCSDDFSRTKELEFMEDMESRENLGEDNSFLAPLPLSPQRQRRKRRRAHVHFSMPGESNTADVECQTEPSEADKSSDSEINHDDKVVNLEEGKMSEELQEALEQSKKQAEGLQARIVELENITSSREGAEEATKEALQASNDRCCELQRQVACLEGKVAGLEDEKAAASQQLQSQEALIQECKEWREKSQELERKVCRLEEENEMVNQLSDALCLSEEKVGELESHIQDADCRVAALTEEVCALTAQLKEKQGSAADTANKLELEILALKAQLEERNEALSLASQKSAVEVSGLQETIQGLEAAVSHLKMEREELSALPQSLKEREAKIEELCRMQQQAEEAITTLKQEKAVMSQQLDEQNSQSKQNYREADEHTAKVQELEEAVQLRDEELEVVNQLLEEQRLELEAVNQILDRQRGVAEKCEEEAAQKMAALAQEVQDLGKLAEERSWEVETLRCRLEEQRPEVKIQMQDSAAATTAQSKQLRDVEKKQESVDEDGGMGHTLPEELTRESVITSRRELKKAEERVKELTRLLGARQDELETLNTFLEEQGKEAEEARSHHVARITELTALLEEQQGQLALSAAVPLTSSSAESKVEPSLADELEAEEWKAKARRTESDLLGSVQLCEEIMEEKTKISQERNQLEAECKSLKESLRGKVSELKVLQELHEFTQIEAELTKEQEVQYQNDIEDLKKKLADQERSLAEQYRQEIAELQKKLGSKDKVLEAEYQRDIDELLNKLREKSQSFNALQEQNAGLIQAVSQKEQLAESLQERLNLLISDGESAIQKIVDSSESSTQVSPDVVGFLTNEAAAQTEAVQDKTNEQVETTLPPDTLQQRVAELESSEAALRQECQALTTTVSSQDQEIEVLKEILQEYQQDDGEADNHTKIAAFAQRIEELEEQLKASASSHQTLPLPDAIQIPVSGQELDALMEENQSLMDALARSQSLGEKLQGKVQDLERTTEQGASTHAELSRLREELGVLTKTNLSLSEKLSTIETYCSKLEAKILLLENCQKKEDSQEIHLASEAVQCQLEDTASQKAELDRMEDDFKSRIKHLEECTKKLRQENQALMGNSQELEQVNQESAREKESLLEEQAVLKQLLEEGSSKMHELEEAVSVLRNQSREDTKTIKNQTDEIEMLRQVLGEQEQQLQATRDDYKDSVSRMQELESMIDAVNRKNADQAMEKDQEENEICRLRSTLEVKEELLQTKVGQNLELQSRIEHLESALDANIGKLQEKIQAEAEQLGEIQRLQECLEEQANRQRSKDEKCMKLEAGLQDLENVMHSRSTEWESTQSRQQEEIQLLQLELDNVRDTFSPLRDSHADLQATFRDQEARIKDMQAVITKQDEELKVFRALLDERNRKVLHHEDKHYEMLTKIENLESGHSNKEHTIKQLEETVSQRDEELQQLYTALSSQEKEFHAQCSELKEQLQAARNSLNTKEDRMKQLEELVEQRGDEVASLQHQLGEYCQQKHRFLTEVSQKEEDLCSLQQALEDAQQRNRSAALEIQALEAQVHQLKAELENLKVSPDLTDDVRRLQAEKNELQAQLEKATKKLQRKTANLDKLDDAFETLQQDHCSLEDKYEEEKAEHQQTKNKLQEAEASQAKLKERDRQNQSVEELMKAHKQQLAEKNLRINELETDLLRGTDPLEDKIRSLRSEVQYQERKVQQYKKEAEKLRSAQSRQGPQASQNVSATAPERPPEATGGSGIIESCAIFAIKAENHKLTKALEKAKRELEHKDMKYHDQVSKKTAAEQETRYWKDKAKSLASHLKRAPTSHVTDAIISSPLKERDANDPTSHQTNPKKFRPNNAPGPKYVEKISGLQPSGQATTAGAPRQPLDDHNWLTKAVAERDAAEVVKGSDTDDPQQCATQ